jgi:serine/threonine protein kinase
MVGTSISHYTVESELGRGGMGIVYKAEDTKLNRTVALKLLPSATLMSEEERSRFYREARSAAALSHPNIATVYAIDEAVPEGSREDDVRPFIAMEFIDGPSLSERIEQGPIDLKEAVKIAIQLASALQVAHEQAIVHRDIKSSNVMLTAKGDVKVLDFGLAKTLQSTKLTMTGSTLGTASYMSPEQSRGEEVDGRSDLWSLGVVLYEMVSGVLPFAGSYEQAVVYGILNDDPRPLTAIRTGVPM